MAAIIGKKVGMTQVFTEDGTVVPVTVIEAGPCSVTAIRDPDRDGYAAVQLAFDEVEERKLTKAELGHLKKAGAPPMRTLVEFRDAEIPVEAGTGGAEQGATDPSAPGREAEDADGGNSEEAAATGPKLGDTVTVSQFEPGQRIKVSGVSIGKGFQGTIRRHNFHRGPVSHGSHNVRAPGSIGASADPARVFKGMRMPGQMGRGRVTQRGLEVFEVDKENNLLLVKGSVPGSRDTVVEVRSE
jgi:large subunit ribosomal protein L3